MSRHDTRCTDPRPEREEELALLAGGDLPPEEAAGLEAHAESCPACRELLAGLRESGAALALLAEDELAADPAALARVRARVRAGVARIDTEREERDTLGVPPRWALAAVLLVALVAAAVWLRSGSSTGPSQDQLRERAPDRRAPVEQAADRAPDPDPVAPDAPAPPSDAPPASRIASARPSDRPAGAPTGGPEAPDASLAAIDPIDPADPIGSTTGAPEAARPAGPEAEPGTAAQITIRVVSDDPDIVFYWLVEPEENRDEDAVSS